MAEREWFDPNALDRFWTLVAERQWVWHRRVVLGEEPPWTDDAVLRERRFTNVYRILDPGTQYAIREILGRDVPAPDRVFDVLWYRLVGRRATHERVGFQGLDGFDAGAFEERLRRVDREAEHPVFTGAYLVAGYAGMGGDDKIENVARLLDEVRDAFEDGFYDELRSAGDPEAAYRAIRGLPGFGNFLAYQVVVDLLYPLPDHDGEPLLPHSASDWAAAGPGAQRGIEVLTAGSGGASDLAAMRWLHRSQDDEFDRLGIEFPWLRDTDGHRIRLSLADVQNCCCEFSKYESARQGDGRARRRFRPAERRSTEALRAVYHGYPISVGRAGDPVTSGRD